MSPPWYTLRLLCSPGYLLDKRQLASPAPLREAVRAVLNEPKYREAAERVARMIRQRPFSMSEIFVKNMEFLAEHGPFRLVHFREY